MEVEWNGCKVSLERGDITRLAVDGVVNAANSHLAGGGGVDGAIHRAGGPAIMAECREIIRRIQRLPAGDAVATTGGNLPAKRVIHTVGPRYAEAGADASRLLASAYRRSLEIALAEGLQSVAFPSISTGIYGYPITEAAPVAIATVRQFLTERGAPGQVIFCLFSDADFAVYRQALAKAGGQ
jgi:O-acetyl-ADP-ribose deacetylase (regulator of RNase III)